MGHENVNATIYDDRDAAEHLVDDCIWEANTRGITEAALIEAAGSDLNEYMLAKLNRVVGREVENNRLSASAPTTLLFERACATANGEWELNGAS
jgi:hypothetical protein